MENIEDGSLDISTVRKWDGSSLKKNPFGPSEFLGEAASAEVDAKLMTLTDALEAGITHNRSYINQKESVFLEALNLTLVQHQLAPIFGGGGNITRQSDARNAAGLTNLVATNTFARNQSASFDMLLRTGARLSTDFTQDFLNFLSGRRDINNSALAVTLIQPLLQRGGRKVTLEALTQADRDVLYALRDFATFRRNFVVDLVSDYYGVLQARDNAFNAYLAYQGFLSNIDREEEFKIEALRTSTQLGQLKQALLLSESRWLNAIRAYEARLDQFKLDLGIPVDIDIVLDVKDLDTLKIEDVTISKAEALKIALATRPDLATSRDRIHDAERQIEVVKNSLKAGLDIRVDYDAISDPGDLSPNLNFKRRNLSTNLDLDLPLDRKSERNNYRASLITKELRQRQYDEDIDQIRIAINDDWRNLDLAKRNYDIAVKGVGLAELRLEEQNLLREIGNGEVRDLVDAQNDLVDAQNQRLSTLIDHTLARLRLWRDLGILYINEDGSWIEKLQNESTATKKY